jgi:hypothetical protein
VCCNIGQLLLAAAAAAHGTPGAAHLAYVAEGLLMPVSSVASRNNPK